MSVFLTTDVSLNGGSVDVTVYEDTDSDGTAENQETVSVADGTNTVELTTLDGGSFGYDYWVDIAPTAPSVTATPKVNRVEVDNGATGDPDAGHVLTRAFLNGGSIDLTVYEDTSGNGTADNQTTFAVPEGTAQTDVTASLELGSGNDYWVEAAPSTTDVARSPRFVKAAINTDQPGVTDSGSITTASASALPTSETATLSEAPGVQTASASALPTSETATLSEAPGVQTAAASVLTPDEFPVTQDDGSLVTAAATSLTAADVVEDVIAGTVTLSGSGVQGAKVYVINTDADTVAGTATTDANGDYSVTVPADSPYHIAVQYDDGSQKYNALSKPFVE